MQHLRHSLFVSTARLDLALPGARTARVGEFYVGGFDAGIEVLADQEQGSLSFETFRLNPDPAPTRNAVFIEGSRLIVCGSDMNTQSIYYIEARNGLVVFNDLFLARPLLLALGLEATYDNEGEGAANLTFFSGISRLRAGERLTVEIGRGAPALRTERLNGLLDCVEPGFESLDESIEAMGAALDQAVGTALAGETSVCIALSGGVDSGTIASLITRRAILLTAYTLGTDWGDEFAGARETADHLGISLTQIHVSSDEIRAELPAVIRFFHFLDPENIQIALVAHCLYRKLHREDPRPRVSLTGYGSDLINGGGVCSSDGDHSYHQRILKELQRTQRSNEFSTLGAAQFGVEVRHPFWDSAVIACALRVPPAHKLRDGTDKFYLRRMFPGALPETTASRSKLGAHRGTGLARHLAAAFGGPAGYRGAVRDLHRSIFEQGRYQ